MPARRPLQAAAALALGSALLGAAAPPILPPDLDPSRPSLGAMISKETPHPVTVPADAPFDVEYEMVTSFHDQDLKLRTLIRDHAHSSTSGTLSAPLASDRRTSSFGGRTSPITGDPAEFHYGQDFGAPCGAEVSAAAGGTVVFAGWHPYGGGNRVEIEHGSGLTTTYNHLSSSSVSVGQHVSRGQALAFVGTTGSSTGCHLHFEVLRDGTHIDPAGWL
ncbi:M23 family metallopeptidase [Arthrobacter sp. IK3]|uniref:M23 family metallopeptidase n=1 Tax=Arthrobacter sp. IK3 TaxID=3448169 RepID=UPI003EE0F400